MNGMDGSREDAVTAWAAIDQLAREYVRDGVCDTVERARGKALTDLVTGHASVSATLRVTIPPTSGSQPRG